MDHLIIAGDFNLHLDPILDCVNVKPSNNSVYRSNLVAFLENNNLVDIWRVNNPSKVFFTWNRGRSMSRYDYIFVSEYLLNTSNCEILPGLHSDHCLLKLNSFFNKKELRGPGLWKFNSCLLQDLGYIKVIKQCITENVKKHANLTDKGLKWDLIKMYIRDASIGYAKGKRKRQKEYEQTLIKNYNEYFEMLQLSDDDKIKNSYEHAKQELESLYILREKEVIFRSKAMWVEQGERCLNYFYHLKSITMITKIFHSY